MDKISAATTKPDMARGKPSLEEEEEEEAVSMALARGKRREREREGF